MSKEYDNTNRGVLFVNEKQREGGNDPDFTGALNIDGREFWLSAWKKVTTKGHLLSVSVKPKDSNPNDKKYADSEPAKKQSKNPW